MRRRNLRKGLRQLLVWDKLPGSYDGTCFKPPPRKQDVVMLVAFPQAKRIVAVLTLHEIFSINGNQVGSALRLNQFGGGGAQVNGGWWMACIGAWRVEVRV